MSVLNFPTLPRVVIKQDECPIQDVDKIKATIVRIRKDAKKKNEDKVITRGKINAVRKHSMDNGDVAVYYNEGDMIYYPVIIRI